MAESKNSTEIKWYCPQYRGIFPLDTFHISRSLRRSLLRDDYCVTYNKAFGDVISACAARPESWINAEITEIYWALHQRGACHSFEVWRDGKIAGGIFGITIGGAFLGESMFTKGKDGSKIALCWLVACLKRAGFTLFDTQFITPHLASLGAEEIPRAHYETLLKDARRLKRNLPDGMSEWDRQVLFKR